MGVGQVMRIITVLIMVTLLSACSSVSLRDVQHAVNANNLYKDSNIKEEIQWKIRSIYGH